jgi:hypothetical protein
MKGNETTKIELNGRVYRVEAGKVTVNLNGEDKVLSITTIRTINEAPTPAVAAMKKQGADLTGRVWVGSCFMPKEIAEEAIRLRKQKWADEESALLKAVPGLRELESAIDAEIGYSEDFDKMMDDEYNDGVNPPVKPTIKSSDLRNQYPVAAAYIKARGYSNASHFAKASAGNTAMDRIKNGEDHTRVLADMEKEWSNYCKGHMFD